MPKHIQGTGFQIEGRGYKSFCWIWQHARNNQGYGVCRKSGKNFLVHRNLYIKHISPILEGTELDHLCKQGHEGCINPYHCEPVTHTENVRRGRRVKLTPEVVKASHQRYLAGETQKALAKELRVHPSVLCDAFQGKIWRGVV